MPHAEHTVTINRPAGDAFSYLADGTHNREWRAGVLEIERTSSVGFNVIAGPARPEGVFELTGLPDNSTQVRFTLDVKPSGAMKLMTPMISRQMQKEVSQLNSLKQILER